MEQISNMIATLGFPIACVCGLGWFVYVAFNKFLENNEKREEKLYQMIEDAKTTNKKLLETNAEFVKVIEAYNLDLSSIRNDVSIIKRYFEVKENDIR